jgi:DNA-binding LacI/PurR family transcriptional regulator
MASLYDVAKLAGVSISTVSRVIHNTVPVDKGTRRRVEDAIKKTNYRPNLLAQGLRGKSRNFIGLVVPEISHNTFARFIDFVEQATRETGFELLLRNTNENPELEEQFIDKLIRLHVSGVIFVRVSDQSRIFRMLNETDIPFVVIDRALKKEDIPTIVLDNYAAGRIAAEHLHSLGHTEVGCITGSYDIFLSRERLRGFTDYFLEQNIVISHSNIFEGDFKFASGNQAARYFLSRQHMPTAIWSQNDLMAIGAIKEFTNAGLSIPKDLSIIGMDDLEVCNMITPSLTSISQPFEEMARKSVEAIINAIDNPKTTQQQSSSLHSKLIIRDSTASPYNKEG